MYPHPKLGCGCDWRFDDHWCRWAVVERTVWSVVIYCRVTLPGHMAPFCPNPNSRNGNNPGGQVSWDDFLEKVAAIFDYSWSDPSAPWFILFCYPAPLFSSSSHSLSIIGIGSGGPKPVSFLQRNSGCSRSDCGRSTRVP